MSLDMTLMLTASPPWIINLQDDAADAHVLADHLGKLGVTARILRGPRMRTKSALLTEFRSRLDFPEYFGNNWDALADCLADLAWLPGFMYVLVVEGAQDLLADESSDQLNVFLRLVERVAARWAEPVSLGEDWDRPAIPFHLLLLRSSVVKASRD